MRKLLRIINNYYYNVWLIYIRFFITQIFHHFKITIVACNIKRCLSILKIMRKLLRIINNYYYNVWLIDISSFITQIFDHFKMTLPACNKKRCRSFLKNNEKIVDKLTNLVLNIDIYVIFLNKLLYSLEIIIFHCIEKILIWHFYLLLGLSFCLFFFFWEKKFLRKKKKRQRKVQKSILKRQFMQTENNHTPFPTGIEKICLNILNN